MSSECRCHLNEWCFYCEMYLPLEEQLDIAIAALEKISRQKVTCNTDDALKILWAVEDFAFEALPQINGKGKE
ncbi:hypothetical protein SD70_27275 [Gordoniibacillus kamchatkensis]|uniref:Uncharacterized protein n=1 Tax=Gordoniibacillus kamchatkensis TaxID=1590651 RepID=A0ABR5ABA0_9BACL|nr:hypothetical protein SD70_27275 [Paenibacillus sp. VKM B-2647]